MDPYALFAESESTEQSRADIARAREAFGRLVKDLGLPPACRESSLALTKLEESFAWARRSFELAATRKE